MTVEEKNINDLKKYMASLTFFIEHEQKSTELVRKTDKVYVESMKVVVLNKGDKVKGRKVN